MLASISAARALDGPRRLRARAGDRSCITRSMLGAILASILLGGCDAPADECTSDGDCEGICESGQCVPAECGFAGGGAACADGELCMEGHCFPARDGGVACDSDFDCEGICESGQCVPGECGLLGGGATCAAGEVCGEGRCYLPAPDGG